MPAKRPARISPRNGIWAARLGLAARAGGDEQKKLRQILASYESCALDSLALRRAATGLVRIGVVIPLTGRFDRYGKTFVQGLRLSVEDHNRDWAPNVTLVLYDSEGDPLVGARKARWLLRDHGVSILIGELFSANTAPLAAASQVVGAVLISPSATNERLAILGDGVFQLHLGNSILAESLLRGFASQSPKGSVGLLVATTPEDSARAEAVVGACKALEIGVAGKEVTLEGASDGITDEASAIEAMGLKPLLVEAGGQNFKVTYPEDFAAAEVVLKGRLR